jgi:amino-acid N-acetyltransferase
VTAIDGIVVGCVEQKIIDAQTVEIGRPGHLHPLSQPAGGRAYGTILHDADEGTGLYPRFISLTNNPRLESLYTKLGFFQESRAGIPRPAGPEARM